MEELLSVGIDVGTTTTSVIFSRIVIEDTSSCFTVPEIRIQSKEVIYYSKIQFTPIKNNLIDKDKLKEMIALEYQRVGITPEQVKSGAVIVTGESLRKENASITAEALSQLAGDFVVATAGPDLESILSGKGSGAYEYSIKNHNRIMNFDIGGGTTNVVVFHDGKIDGKGCMDLGGRMVRLEDGHVSHLSPSARYLCIKYNISINVGDKINEKTLELLAQRTADEILRVYEQGLINSELQTQDSSTLRLTEKPHGVSFSGGVALCMKSEEEDMLLYGDFGMYLGRALAQKVEASSLPVIETKETIHATVVGVGTYATEVSGSTIYDYETELPIKNVPVVYLEEDKVLDSINSEFNIFENKLQEYYKENKGELCALGMKGIRNPSYKQVVKMAQQISYAVEKHIPPEEPVLIVMEQDMAKALGHKLYSFLKGQRKILCIDRIIVHEGDYVDFGKPIMKGAIIPVIVKTLLFDSLTKDTLTEETLTEETLTEETLTEETLTK